jgi:hypothetical protein
MIEQEMAKDFLEIGSDSSCVKIRCPETDSEDTMKA